MKKILFVFISACAVSFCFAQNERKYDLLLSSGTVILEPNFEKVKVSPLKKTEMFRGVYYRYIQFNDIPSTEQKERLSNIGIKLLMYLPNNTYISSIAKGTDLNTANSAGIRGIYEIKPHYKLLKELQDAISEKNFPAYALKGNKVGISFTYYEGISHEIIKSHLKAKGYAISFEDKTSRWFVVWVKKTKILNFVSEPYVCSAELVDDVGMPENNVGSTSQRSNVISTDYAGGRKYNGSTVNIALQDDGFIGPHIDYQGRIGSQYTSANSSTDHGDHCAGTIMGAGNLNPLRRGMAWGSQIYVYSAQPGWAAFTNIGSHYNTPGIRIISTSYSDGCNAGYTTLAQQLDIQNLSMPELIHVFSAGNNGTSNCNYGAGTGWGNVTGGHKHSKNSIAVANLTYIDVRNSSSSRGPAHDGRLKPEVSSVGTNVFSTVSTNTYVSYTGTSMSCPAVAGLFAQLYQAYKELNTNTNPPSALIKAIVMNTADDIGNPGPDFGHGYGRVNGLNAVKTIEQVNYLNASINHSATNTHTISVPPGVRKIKVMTYWHDYQAAVSASVALVNNINTTLTDPSLVIHNPLILDFTPNAVNLNANAIPGIDTRNNHEQVTLINPAAGIYTLTTHGASIPMGPQSYFVTWTFETDAYALTFPIGGEGFVPGETETIRWDAYETSGNQTLEYTSDNGATWTLISNGIAGSQRYYNWGVPSVLSGQCRLKISRGSYSAESDTNFSIIPLPTNINVLWACPDSIKLTWTAAVGATSYDVFKLGTTYMDSIGTSSTNSIVIPNTLSSQTHWFSVRSRGPLSAVGRRAIAKQKLPGIISCPVVNDASCLNIINPSGSLSDCQNLSAVPVKITLSNVGTNVISGIPVFYSVNGAPAVSGNYSGTISPSTTVAYTFTGSVNMSSVGNYQIKVWATYPLDQNFNNDTIVNNVPVVAGTNATLPLVEDFETFTLCGTNNDCGSTLCNLSNGFINETSGSDQHDWRTDFGGSSTPNTGPSVDYVPGSASGNYVYIESSANCASLTANMLSPCINLSSVSNPLLSFAYHMYGASMGTLYLDLFTSGTWNNSIWSMTGDQGTSWKIASIDLSPWSSNTVNFRWRGVTGNHSQSNMALDAINVLSTTGIQNLQEISGVSIFPNPSDGIFNITISLKMNTDITLALMDVSGRVIWNQHSTAQSGEFKSTLNLQNFAPGMYTLVLKRNLTVDYIKLLKV
jgi:subtilisin family serine protease